MALFLVLSAFILGAVVAYLSGAWLQVAIAAWNLVFGIVLFYGLKRLTARSITISVFGFYAVLLLMLTVGGADSSLWVHDSIHLHIPGIRSTLDFLHGSGELVLDSVFGSQIQLTHLWTGLWFWLLGESPLVSAIAMLALRAATWFLSFRIAKEFFGERVAVLTVALMALTPTQIFYAMPLYKDPMIQLLTVAVFWSALRVYVTGNPVYLALSAFGLASLSLERFYVGPTMAVSVAIAIAFSVSKRFFYSRMGALVVGGSVGLGLFWRLFRRDFDITKLQSNLEWVRQGFQGYADVDRAWNMEIPYPVAFLKILFTPFFTPKKLTMFTDLSAMLTWGSLFSQIVIGLSLVGIFSEWRRNRTRTAIFVVPLLLFLLFFAYLAPFSGRQRDGYFLVTAVFAAVAIDRGLAESILDRLKLVFRIGLKNILTVLVHRLRVRFGLYAAAVNELPMSEGEFFTGTRLKRQNNLGENVDALRAELAEYRVGVYRHFFATPYSFPESKFDFLLHPKSGERGSNKVPWYRAGTGGADVKWIWDLSRLHWAVSYARAATLSSENNATFRDALVELNASLKSWSIQNPGYRGVNWACGQEASIRVLHFMVTAVILGELNSLTSLAREFILLHLRRIETTLGYGLAQENNHGLTESLALALCAEVLIANRVELPEVQFAAKKGRQSFRTCLKKLVQADGSFPLYSINYHRAVLQVLNMGKRIEVELGRSADLFEGDESDRIERLFNFLFEMVDEKTGHAPNIGPNDGSNPFHLGNEPFADFRPALVNFAALFRGERLFPDFNSQSISWLGVTNLKAANKVRSPLFVAKDFGLVRMLRQGGRMAITLRVPNDIFRPIQRDALHIDLIVDGKPVLFDRGTGSYVDYPFDRLEDHNTVCWEGKLREALDERRGSFLYLNWLHGSVLNAADDFAQIEYSFRKFRHLRKIRIRENFDGLVIAIHDEGTKYSANDKPTLMFNLGSQLHWIMNDEAVEAHDSSIGLKIRCLGDLSRYRFRLGDGRYAEKYGKVEISQSATVEMCDNSNDGFAFESEIEIRFLS